VWVKAGAAAKAGTASSFLDLPAFDAPSPGLVMSAASLHNGTAREYQFYSTPGSQNPNRTEPLSSKNPDRTQPQIFGFIAVSLEDVNKQSWTRHQRSSWSVKLSSSEISTLQAQITQVVCRRCKLKNAGRQSPSRPVIYTDLDHRVERSIQRTTSVRYFLNTVY